MAETNPPSNNLHIKDLPEGTDDETLRNIFNGYGTVDHVRIMTSPEAPGKVAAFVKLKTQEEAEWIVENLNGNIPQGLSGPIRVSFAHPPRSSFASSAGPYGVSGGGLSMNRPPRPGDEAVSGIISLLQNANPYPNAPVWHCLYVANLPADTMDRDLLEMFTPFGAIPAQGCKSVLNPDGSCKGFGFVYFTDEYAAGLACTTLNGTMMPWGKQLMVKAKEGGKGKDKFGKSFGKGKGGGGDGKGYGWKTRLCFDWQKGCCTRPADQCRFAHGHAELNPEGGANAPIPAGGGPILAGGGPFGGGGGGGGKDDRDDMARRERDRILHKDRTDRGIGGGQRHDRG